MLNKVAQPIFRRGFSSTARKWSGFNADELKPEFHMMFKKRNPLAFTVIFALFCSSGFSAPFILARHQLMKK